MLVSWFCSGKNAKSNGLFWHKIASEWQKPWKPMTVEVFWRIFCGKKNKWVQSNLPKRSRTLLNSIQIHGLLAHCSKSTRKKRSKTISMSVWLVGGFSKNPFETLILPILGVLQNSLTKLERNQPPNTSPLRGCGLNPGLHGSTPFHLHPRKLRLQWKINHLKMYPIKDGNFPVSCRFSGVYVTTRKGQSKNMSPRITGPWTEKHIAKRTPPVMARRKTKQ